MRVAEISTAVLLAVFSVYLMWHATVLPIGWVEGTGPGGGAFPFWLSAGMLVFSLVALARGWRGTTPQGRSGEPFIDPDTRALILISILAITALIGLTVVIGAYAAIFLFVLFYLGFIGRHRWITTLTIAVLMPVVLFFFFEVGMKIFLPKGITEPLFFPLYAIFF